MTDAGRTQLREEIITPGHVGVVYQALNTIACGRSTPRTLTYVPRRGLVVSDRVLSKVRAQEPGAAAAEARLCSWGARARRAGEDPRTWLRDALVDVGATRVSHPGNFRYAWPLGGPAQRRAVEVAMPSTRYPKPDVDVLPVR